MYIANNGVHDEADDDYLELQMNDDSNETEIENNELRLPYTDDEGEMNGGCFEGPPEGGDEFDIGGYVFEDRILPEGEGWDEERLIQSNEAPAQEPRQWEYRDRGFALRCITHGQSDHPQLTPS